MVSQHRGKFIQALIHIQESISNWQLLTNIIYSIYFIYYVNTYNHTHIHAQCQWNVTEYTNILKGWPHAQQYMDNIRKFRWHCWSIFFHISCLGFSFFFILLVLLYWLFLILCFYCFHFPVCVCFLIFPCFYVILYFSKNLICLLVF